MHMSFAEANKHVDLAAVLHCYKTAWLGEQYTKTEPPMHTDATLSHTNQSTYCVAWLTRRATVGTGKITLPPQQNSLGMITSPTPQWERLQLVLRQLTPASARWLCLAFAASCLLSAPQLAPPHRPPHPHQQRLSDCYGWHGWTCSSCLHHCWKKKEASQMQEQDSIAVHQMGNSLSRIWSRADEVSIAVSNWTQ